MNKNIFIIIGLNIVVLAGFFLFFSNYFDAELNNEPVTEVPATERYPIESRHGKEGYITATDLKSGVVFTHPETFGTDYISDEQWPPTFTNSDQPINCELDEQTVAMSGFASRTETINGTSYCIRERSEGAAGSVFVEYEVIFQKQANYLTMNFTLMYPQCGNYPAAEQITCQAEQDNFPLYTIIDEIAQSVFPHIQ